MIISLSSSDDETVRCEVTPQAPPIIIKLRQSVRRPMLPVAESWWPQGREQRCIQLLQRLRTVTYLPPRFFFPSYLSSSWHDGLLRTSLSTSWQTLSVAVYVRIESMTCYTRKRNTAISMVATIAVRATSAAFLTVSHLQEAEKAKSPSLSVTPRRKSATRLTSLALR